MDNGEGFGLEPFQEAFLSDVFAGYPECWLIIPEGNGKTSLLAALALYHCENRARASVTVAAASVQQTRTLYRQAEGFILDSPELHDTFEAFSGFIEIRCAVSRGLIKIWAADDRTADGTIPTLALIEEGHRHKDLALYRLWRGKLDKRSDGINQIVLISTAGDPFGEFEEKRTEMRQLAEKVERYETFGRYVGPGGSYVLHEWAVPEDGDTEDLKLVTKANPLLTLEQIKAKRASPVWNQQHWNRMVCGKATRSSDVAITEEEWQRAQTAERIPAGKPIWLGVDIGWKTDTTALVPFWAKSKDFRLLGPATVLEAPNDGMSLHPNAIKQAIREIHKANPIALVVIDDFGARDIAAWIAEEFKVPVRNHSQERTQAATDYEHFMEALRNGHLKHTGDKALTRHAMSTRGVLLPSGKVYFDKLNRSERGEKRVYPNDALIAAAMVHSEFVGPQDQKPKWSLIS